MSRKDEIINDLKYLCREDSQISQTTAHKIFEAISWEWTENRDGDGKSSCKGNGYYGCEYWSESAIKTVYKVKDIEEAKGQIQSNDIRSLVTHEHVIPKNLFITYMDTLHKRGKEIEKEWLDERLIACIVTKAEAKALDCKSFGSVQKCMPEKLKGLAFDKLNEDDIWARYKLIAEKAKEKPCDKCTNNNCEKFEQCKEINNINVCKIEWDWNGKKPVIKEITKNVIKDI